MNIGKFLRRENASLLQENGQKDATASYQYTPLPNPGPVHPPRLSPREWTPWVSLQFTAVDQAVATEPCASTKRESFGGEWVSSYYNFVSIFTVIKGFSPGLVAKFQLSNLHI